MPSTEELVKDAKAGDIAAFAELVRRYERTMIVAAWSAVGDFHTAQDVAQEAFVFAYRKLHQLRDNRAFGPWVQSIVKREAKRARSRRPQEVYVSSVLEDTIPATDGWMQQFQELVPLLAHLPEQERLVVTLRYLDGLSVRQVADATGRPLGTVTKQLSRAIKRLRSFLIEAER